MVTNNILLVKEFVIKQVEYIIIEQRRESKRREEVEYIFSEMIKGSFIMLMVSITEIMFGQKLGQKQYTRKTYHKDYLFKPVYILISICDNPIIIC